MVCNVSCKRIHIGMRGERFVSMTSADIAWLKTFRYPCSINGRLGVIGFGKTRRWGVYLGDGSEWSPKGILVAHRLAVRRAHRDVGQLPNTIKRSCKPVRGPGTFGTLLYEFWLRRVWSVVDRWRLIKLAYPPLFRWKRSKVVPQCYQTILQRLPLQTGVS
ncbi:hypothetical protein L211DRAFT_709912 [Terfezia boudieri ATCC MYA-4762]|uniref:Uncharacterized protein n=1 Tax=Terfezia boudieri ATCC MYA-4762 TaxID=1051890 RepID=A0A3N4LYV9_9PEZI|nr:hypothetical protein L211DRAFT_709912 [Terfezia boudieri ATCC MYA-4762]